MFRGRPHRRGNNTSALTVCPVCTAPLDQYQYYLQRVRITHNKVFRATIQTGILVTLDCQKHQILLVTVIKVKIFIMSCLNLSESSFFQFPTCLKCRLQKKKSCEREELLFVSSELYIQLKVIKLFSVGKPSKNLPLYVMSRKKVGNSPYYYDKNLIDL